MNEPIEDQPVHLGAGALGWIWPGLGHLRNGEGRRGRLVMLGVVGLFLLGVLIGGVDCVDRREDGLWFVAQAGAGPIAFATDAANTYLLKSGRMGELLSTVQPNGSVTQVNVFRSVGVVNDMGTLFTAMAGLMNLAAVLDAMRGPRRESA
jgi:TM2 domain-containing membrane protein YozV